MLENGRAPALDIGEVTDAAGLAALEPEWQALFARAADPTPFQSYEWQATWWRHYGRGRLWVLCARVDGELVGLMPLVIHRYRGTPLRQVRFLGAPLSDFQEPLVAPEHAASCRDAFLAHMLRERRRWDLADFADQRAGTPLAVAEAPAGLRLTREHHRVCPYIPLAPTWEALRAGLSKNMRANLGRRRRQVAKEFHAEYDVADAATLPAALEELFRLHNARWRRRGVSGAFSGERVQGFHREVAALFLARGWLRLHRLRLDGVTRAAFYCFHLGARTYYYLSGFDVAFGKYSIGNVLMAEVVERAIAEGTREFDFLRGDETYKLAWQARERETLRLILGAGGWRSAVARGVHRFERYVEHRGLAAQRWLWGRKRPVKAGAGAAAGEGESGGDAGG